MLSPYIFILYWEFLGNDLLLPAIGNNLGTTWEQLGNNLGTTWEQLGNNLGTTWEQLGNNLETTWEQLVLQKTVVKQ
jgi:Flp pilus assembly pilin Flp